MDQPQRFSIIDIETTGSVGRDNKITEIAIINFDGEKIEEKFETLINPERNIPYTITRLTGITNEMVAEAPKFYEVAKKIVEMTEGRIFVAHNVFFDYNFLQHEFRSLGYTFKREKACTVRLSRKILPGHKSYSLGRLAKDLGIVIKARHRAMGDAAATTELLQLLLKKSPDGALSFVVQEKKNIALPAELDRREYDNLPDATGVYYLLDREGHVLYVGKAKSIKSRVASHFRLNVKRRKDIELKNRIASLDFIITGDELSALLYECHEIKRLRPQFNTSLNRKNFRYAIEIIQEDSGELGLKIQRPQQETIWWRYLSRLKAQRALNSFYRREFGLNPQSLTFQNDKDVYIKIHGLEHFNHKLRSSFEKYQNLPQDFSVPLKGRGQNEQSVLIVKDHSPIEIVYLDKDGEKVETISLKSDPDMVILMYKFLEKNRKLPKKIS